MLFRENYQQNMTIRSGLIVYANGSIVLPPLVCDLIGLRMPDRIEIRFVPELNEHFLCRTRTTGQNHTDKGKNRLIRHQKWAKSLLNAIPSEQLLPRSVTEKAVFKVEEDPISFGDTLGYRICTWSGKLEQRPMTEEELHPGLEVVRQRLREREERRRKENERPRSPLQPVYFG